MKVSANAEKVVEALTRIAPNGRRERTPLASGSTWHARYFAMPGRTRDRIVVQTALVRPGEQPDWDREQRFVKCFVERRDGGLILYAGGWDSPATWKDGPASEFVVDEADLYAQFVADGGWGYKGDRAAWEQHLMEKEVGV
jgi:hypothetical protein